MMREGGLRLIARRWWGQGWVRRSCRAEGEEAGAELISRGC